MRSASRRAAAASPCLMQPDRFGDLLADRMNTGLSDVIGSWKIIAISAPRMSRIVAASAPARDRCAAPLGPREIERARTMMRPPPCSTSRITDSAVTDLPEPDSPTMAIVSPRADVNETSRTAGDDALGRAELDREPGHG